MPKIRSVVVWTVAALVTAGMEIVGLHRAIALRNQLDTEPSWPGPRRRPRSAGGAGDSRAAEDPPSRSACCRYETTPSRSRRAAGATSSPAIRPTLEEITAGPSHDRRRRRPTARWSRSRVSAPGSGRRSLKPELRARVRSPLPGRRRRPCRRPEDALGLRQLRAPRARDGLRPSRRTAGGPGPHVLGRLLVGRRQPRAVRLPACRRRAHRAPPDRPGTRPNAYSLRFHDDEVHVLTTRAHAYPKTRVVRLRKPGAA